MKLEQRLYKHYKRETARPKRTSFVLVDMIGYAAAAAVITAAFVTPAAISPLARGYTSLFERAEVRTAVANGFTYYQQAIGNKKYKG